MNQSLLLFVHGWSVTSTATYGGLPARLKAEAARAGGPALDVAHVHLGQYVSFRDEVTVADLARAFARALAAVLADAGPGRRFVAITHSTGGPVLREWLDRDYVKPGRLDACPMSHLVMLAPANHGSALAQLGKSRLAGMKAWFNGVEPGTGVLDWLELASPESIALNLDWIHAYPALKLTRRVTSPVFPFVLTGDAIDRKLYDHVNAYTGETGSDGVVRVAAANLDCTHVVLAQPELVPGETLPAARRRLKTLQRRQVAKSAPCAFKIVPGVAHSGTAMGIMASVDNDDRPHPTVDAILRCLRVRDGAGYEALRREFAAENAAHQRPQNRVEVEKVPVLPDRRYIHDPHAQVIFRLLDGDGRRVPDMNVLLTAGPAGDPNQLPQGFLSDRQGNRRAPGNLAFFLNHAVLTGDVAIADDAGRVLRPALVPRPPYGLSLRPREEDRWVEHWPAELGADIADLVDLIAPNQTTIVDLVLTRVVREGVFRFTRGGGAFVPRRRTRRGRLMLLALEPRTIFLVATLMILLNGAVLGVMHASLVADVQPAAKSWRIGTLLVAMGCLLQAMQPWLPLALAAPLANALILLGMTGYLLALRLFHDLPARGWMLAPTLLGTAAIAWFAIADPQLPARLVAFSLAVIVILVACVQVMRRHGGPEPMVSQRVLMAMFALVALVMALRVGFTLGEPPAGNSLLDNPDPIHAAAVLMTATLPVIGTTAFVLMCLERIRGQWQHAASTDYLTGLANRRTVAEAGERALHAARRLETPLAVAIVDADHFKRINDTWGHAIGDHALKHLADLLVATARRSDLPGRLGGEEFVLLLEGADAAQAIAAAERYRDALRAQPLTVDGRPMPLTVSVGIAVLAAGDRHFDDLMRRADSAMYAAKSGGRDRVELAPD